MIEPQPAKPFTPGLPPPPAPSTQSSLEQQRRDLQQEIVDLQARRDRLLQDQAQGVQAAVTRLIEEGVAELEQRRSELQASIEQLERRQERIRAEMRKSFVGVSQDLAVRVQGFKEYLVGSLQDLAVTAEQLDLATGTGATGRSEANSPPAPEAPLLQRPTVKRSESRRPRSLQSLQISPPPATPEPPGPEAAPPTADDEVAPSSSSPFGGQAARIRQLLEQYQAMPNYYGKPWQLRRTFEPVHAERASQWLFDLGGRGAVKTMGSRLQNVLIASAVISILRELQGDRVRALILSDSPERLGEWRRGLQDCLGISRADFGAQRGVMLFEAPESAAQRAERLVEQGQMPLILIDEGEDKVSLSLLQFPLWLAFAPDPAEPPALY